MKELSRAKLQKAHLYVLSNWEAVDYIEGMKLCTLMKVFFIKILYLLLILLSYSEHEIELQNRNELKKYK